MSAIDNVNVASSAAAGEKTKKPRLTAQQFAHTLEELQTSVEHLNSLLMKLMPHGSNLRIGDKLVTRKEIADTVASVDSSFNLLVRESRKGLRRDTTVKGKTPTGLNKPQFYHKELIDFFLSENLGTVDPSNPKSDKLKDVLKKSCFGKHSVATNHTITRLVSIYSRANNLSTGKSIRFSSPTLLTDKMPTVVAKIKEHKPNFNPAEILHIDGNIIGTRAVLPSTEEQRAELEKYKQEANDLDALILSALEKYRHDNVKGVPAPAPVQVPTPKSPSKRSQASPKKNTK